MSRLYTSVVTIDSAIFIIAVTLLIGCFVINFYAFSVVRL